MPGLRFDLWRARPWLPGIVLALLCPVAASAQVSCQAATPAVAVRDCTAALARNPEDASAFFTRSQAELRLHLLARAVADASAAIGIDQAFAQPSMALALTAARQGQTGLLTAVLADGASAAGIDDPLPLDAVRGHPDLVRKLVDAGASVDETNKAGLDALDIAVAADDVAQAKLLVSLGAYAGCDAPDHRSLVEMVFQDPRQDGEMMKVLLDGGGNPGEDMASPQPGVDVRAQFDSLGPSIRAAVDPWAESYKEVELAMASSLAITKFLNSDVGSNALRPGDVSAALFGRIIQAGAGGPLNAVAPEALLIPSLLQGLRSPPPIPPLAQTDAAAGEAMFQAAQTPSAILMAAAVYEQAVRVAPWVPEYHKRLCTLYQLGGAFYRAAFECEMYGASSAAAQAEIMPAYNLVTNDLKAVHFTCYGQ
jgi:hypothetical protein